MLYREYPEKSFKSFSLLANALPIGIPAEGLGLGILQPEIGILQPDWYSSDSWGIGFPEGYFSAETFHNAYPSAGMPTGRVFAEWLKDLKEKKGVSACRYRYGKNNRSNFKKLLFFQWKRPVLFFKDLVLFGKEQDLLRVSNVYAGRLVTCHPTRY